jgi:hypothetical protein
MEARKQFRALLVDAIVATAGKGNSRVISGVCDMTHGADVDLLNFLIETLCVVYEKPSREGSNAGEMI